MEVLIEVDSLEQGIDNLKLLFLWLFHVVVVVSHDSRRGYIPHDH